MARAHSKTVIDAIITALKAITTDRSDSFTPISVQRHDDDRANEGPVPTILVRRTGTPKNRDAGSGWLVTLGVELQVALYTGPETDTTSDEIIEEAEEDVFRALVAMDWQTLRAEFAGFTPTSFRDIDEEHPVSGFLANVGVEYKVAYDDPGTIIDM